MRAPATSVVRRSLAARVGADEGGLARSSSEDAARGGARGVRFRMAAVPRALSGAFG